MHDYLEYLQMHMLHVHNELEPCRSSLLLPPTMQLAITILQIVATSEIVAALQ
jgi:hypothetical protein